MFRPAQILIQATVESLAGNYRAQFNGGHPEHERALVDAARAALYRQSRTNALYTNLEASILLVHCAEDLLRGKAIQEGLSSEDWLHFVLAALHTLIGFVREICPGDDGRECATNEFGDSIRLERGQTDGALWLYAVDRARLFVTSHYRDHPVIDAERIAEMIDYTRLPVPRSDCDPRDQWPELLRAVQFVAAVANPRFYQRLKPLFLQLSESSLTRDLGYADAAEIRASYPTMFWQVIYPQIVCAVDYLKFTGEGMSWVANMNANMLVEEHRQRLEGGAAAETA